MYGELAFIFAEKHVASHRSECLVSHLSPSSGLLWLWHINYPTTPFLPPLSPSHHQQVIITMKFMLSSFLSLGGRNNNNKSIEPDQSSSFTTAPKLNSKLSTSPTTMASNKKRNSYLACQRFIGRPMTRAEAAKKMESCPKFRDMVATDGDAVQNAIGLEYGSRLRSCVERSKRNLYHHGNRAHY